MPCTGPAHGKAAQDDAFVIDQPFPTHGTLEGKEMVDRLENVDLASPAIGIVAATKNVQPNVILIRWGYLVAVETVEELHLRQARVAAMQHDVDAPLLARLLAIGRR